MKTYLPILLVVLLAISACTAQGTQQSTQTPQTPQPGTQEPAASASLIGPWKLTAYGPVGAPTPAVEGAQAGLTFNEDGTINGSSGCNGLGGDYSVEGDRITFGEFVSTLMACDAPIMEQESAAHKVMTGTASYTLEGDTLTITNNDTVLVLTRGDYVAGEPSAPASLVGAWKLTSYGAGGTVTSALPEVEANLTFNDDGTLTGTSGCNEFGGSYTVDGNKITFTDIVSTLKLCDEPLMGQEEAITQALLETATYQIEGNTLTITNKDRVLVLTR